jgi:hypothetical protein
MQVNTVQSNVFQFPNKHLAEVSEIQSRIHEMQLLSVAEASEFLFPPIFEAIIAAGFNNCDEDKITLLNCLIEAILSSHFKLPNSLNNFIDAHSTELNLIMRNQS